MAEGATDQQGGEATPTNKMGITQPLTTSKVSRLFFTVYMIRPCQDKQADGMTRENTGNTLSTWLKLFVPDV